jgi:hypothetical protein
MSEKTTRAEARRRVNERFKTGRLVDRLLDHALGERTLTPTQFQAAKLLLIMAWPERFPLGVRYAIVRRALMLEGNGQP